MNNCNTYTIRKPQRVVPEWLKATGFGFQVEISSVQGQFHYFDEIYMIRQLAHWIPY